MQIIDFCAGDEKAIRQAANLLIDGFKDHWPNAWPDLASARKEVQEALQPDRINRIAVDAQGAVLGWIGGRSEYDGNAWELHPLVVRPDQQGKGIGRMLVNDLEAQVRERGGITIYLGTDDEDRMTTLADVDLYPNVLEHITRIKNLRRHPYEFYQKQGYVIVGVIPDANGAGKPDIIMAKRVRR
ncbi:MAG: GNAT family N-acetyltransferase [Chloroflexi bacterium]|nr:GNAT family N-acetyltransferase [Chloroflexota bacterium]